MFQSLSGKQTGSSNIATIASILVNFEAATAGYLAGSKTVRDDGASLTSTFSSSATSIIGAFAAIAGGYLSARGAISFLQEAASRVTDLAHKSQELSVSTEQLSRFHFAAQQTGVEAETMDHAILKLQENIGKASTVGGEAAETFNRLHLNVAQLVRLSPDQQFRQIAEAIGEIHDPAQRAAAEVELFGKSGAQLNGLLAQGGQGIDALSAKADALGITVNEVDAQKVLAANNAVNELEGVLGAVGNQLVSQVAPAVTDIINRFVDWSAKTGFVQRVASSLFQVIEYGAAGVVEVYALLKSGGEAWAAGLSYELYGLTEGFAKLADGASWLMNKVFGMKIDTKGIDDAANYLLDKAHQLNAAAGKDFGDAMSGASAAKVFEYFDKTGDSATKSAKAAADAAASYRTALNVPTGPTENNVNKIASAIAELHKEVDTFGMSEGAKKLYDLQHDGASPGQLAEATALSHQLDLLKQAADERKKMAEDNKRLDEEAKRIKEDAMGPLEKEKAHIAELTKLYQTGRITKAEFIQADIASQKNNEIKNPTGVTAGRKPRSHS